VTVHVLGPPTVEQTDTIKKQRSSDPDQFWQFQAKAIGSDEAVAEHKQILFPKYVEAQDNKFPIRARWLRYHSRTMRGEQLLQIVRMLDQQMNNTSVILIFQVGKTLLLFPGDAQIENWQFALDQKKYQSLLRNVNLYKVGHHGSRNATPRSLVTLWQPHTRPFVSMMSTLPDVHGETEATAVPRATLVTALEGLGALYRTDKLAVTEMSTAVSASTRDRKAFIPTVA
jgi:hypothetical protein